MEMEKYILMHLFFHVHFLYVEKCIHFHVYFKYARKRSVYSLMLKFYAMTNTFRQH